MADKKSVGKLKLKSNLKVEIKDHMKIERKDHKNNENWGISENIQFENGNKSLFTNWNWQMRIKKKPVCKTARRAHSQKKINIVDCKWFAL